MLVCNALQGHAADILDVLVMLGQGLLSVGLLDEDVADAGVPVLLGWALCAHIDWSALTTSVGAYT